MVKDKTSIIWKVSAEDFSYVIKGSLTYKEALSRLGLQAKSGGNYKTLKQRLTADAVDVSHIEAGKKLFRGTQQHKSLTDSLVLGSSFRNSSLRERLIREGLLENKCRECGQLPWWNGKELVLQLDHINGDHSDNRLDNLRILCPHCHTQTETYGGRNSKTILDSDFCKCGTKKKRSSTTCLKCRPYIAKEKIQWPDKESLQTMLLTRPTSQLAKELGVSDVAIGRRAKKLGLNKPRRGFWIGAGDGT